MPNARKNNNKGPPKKDPQKSSTAAAMTEQDSKIQDQILQLPPPPHIRISDRENKGNPPNRYGFSINHNETPFVLTDSGHPSTVTNVNDTIDEYFNNTIKSPQCESTVIETNIQPVTASEIRHMFDNFHVNMMKSLKIHDSMIQQEIGNVKQVIDDKLNGMMNLIQQNDNEIQMLKQNQLNLPSSAPFSSNKTVETALPPSNMEAMHGKFDYGHSSNQNFLEIQRKLGRKEIHDLPLFDGRPEDWPLFLTSFNETTKSFSYTNMENSLRLRKCLSGKALEAVKAMIIHPDNVPTIIQELEFRFGRPELLLKSQIHKIRQTPTIKEDDLGELINFSTSIKNMVSFLQNAKAEQYLQNPFLLEELLNKLPLQRRLEWAEQLIAMDHSPSITDFSLWVSRIAKMASLIETTISLNTSSKHKSVAQKHSMLATEVKSNPKCIYCQDAHYLNQCKKFNEISVYQRWEWVKKSSVCFSCLRKGHRLYDCRNRKRCGVDGCNLKHHILLHDIKNKTTELASTPLSNQKHNEKPTVLSLCQSTDNVYFRVAPIILFGRNKQIYTFALLDEGSSMTIMDRELMDELELDSKSTTLTMQWLNDGIATENTEVADCYIQGAMSGCEKLLLKDIHAWSNLKLPCQTVNAHELISAYPQLACIDLQNFSNAQPRVLIGLDNCRVGLAKSWIDCPPSGPIAAETPLGWILYGPAAKQEACKNHILLVHSAFHDESKIEYDELNQLVQNYYELENFGVQRPSKILQSNENIRAQNILESTTLYKGSYYEAGLIWKSDYIEMPPSYNMALNRLYNLERKIINDEQYRNKYCKSMNDFLEKNYARKLSEDEAQVVDEKTWYLPHFGVINVNKPDKIRIVFDAAAAVDKVSLNSQLLKGPDLNCPLLSVLSQFRERPIAVCADIQEMFCQIRIRPEDRQAQRFLWRDGKVNEPVGVYEMTSMIFGAASSPATAQFVKNHNADKYKNDYPEAVKAIKLHHYVDDFVMSFENEEQAIQISNQVKSIHMSANFNLRNFISNSTNVIQALDENDEKSIRMVNFNVESGIRNEKVLGMFWRNSTDEFVFDIKFHKVPEAVIQQTRPPSKRELLSMIMSIFDPFGFIANFHVYAKILLQSLWTFSLSWDAPIPDEVATKWFEFQSKLEGITCLSIPRCYFMNQSPCESLQLHIFVDASIDAYASVAYWRKPFASYSEVSFIYGKARVAPRKMLSIPRMELQAGVLGVRMKQSILGSHSILPTETYFWTDSKTILQWIKSESRAYKPFVAHRVAEIQEISEVNNWHWLPSNMNVADEATRAKLPQTFNKNDIWLNGPEFLHKPILEIPQQPIDLINAEINAELRPILRKMLIIKVQSSLLPNLNNFSRYLRLKRTVAWCFRAVNILLSKIRRCVPELKTVGLFKGELTSVELNHAEEYMCRVAQQDAFGGVYEKIKSNSQLQPSDDLYNLSPYIDNSGLLRIQGRIDAATIVPLSTRRPIILPKNHRLTNLIIAFYHEQFKHANNESVICKIREKFWIPHVRQKLNSVRYQCQHCRIENAKPKQPQMGPLPYDRLAAFVKPFTYTGLDYFGPIYVAIGRRREKRWVALFTCLTIRAIHLELASDLSTDSCILCLRNFINIRGVPKRIRSDNGTNFVGIEKELVNVPDFFDTGAIQRELSNFGIEWFFNSPHDPSAGGVWERLVQSVKRSLYSTLKDRVPREDTLRSLLLEAANIVNSRPLTHVPVSSDSEDPLTPNHFLIGTINSTTTPGDVNEKLMCLRKQWRISQQLKNHFYSRWIKEYLPILTRRSKWFEKIPKLKEDDLVLICEIDLPRSKWLRGRVVKTFEGKDGQIRTAEVQTMNGVLRRPVNKLALLNVVNHVDSREGECGLME